MPFLNEEEFEKIKGVLRQIKNNPERSMKNTKEWREPRVEQIEPSEYSQIIKETLRPLSETFERLTGFAGVDPNAVYHHRLSNLGPDCPDCSKPLRTPRAKLCPECGWQQ
jgi:hypothetical protein